MMTGKKNFGNAIILTLILEDFRASIDIRARDSALFQRVNVAENSLYLASNGINHDHRRELASCEDKRSDGNLLHPIDLLYPYINPLIATTDQNNIFVFLRSFLRVVVC